ncbi:iron-sulfur protein [Streptomyces oryzae]|uniref:Iron-sulfur protein n=1 Tax=Streptomyces oryzae TaxID=1434886 RepID=A0ABS3XIZ4_9ACTN|nr:iron-sulfur protein [Streptomyces oryzae]MBO8195378.1 iron-sulfur protein [Streptomyces oryzae]
MSTPRAARRTPHLHPSATPRAPDLLTGLYERTIAICEALNARVMAEDGTEVSRPRSQRHVSGAALRQDSGALDRFIGAEAARIQQRAAHQARRDVAASRALHGYAWSVALLMSGSWYLERRVPRVRPGDIRVDLETGAVGIAPGQSFSCLADDEAARHSPGARVLVDEEALRAELRSAVADHMRPLLTAFAPEVRRGPRALWGMVEDDLVSGIWYLGRMLGQEEDAVRAATELLPGPVPPFPGGAAFRYLTSASGRSFPTRTRVGCCLYYTIGTAQPCLTCPRTSDGERLRRLES